MLMKMVSMDFHRTGSPTAPCVHERANMSTTIDFAYKAFCEERFPLPSEGQITEIETRIGVVFPADYRLFLLEYNGGFFNEPRMVSPDEDCPDDLLTVLYGIGATHPTAELATRSDMALFDDNYPAQLVPIGYTIMGNLIGLITHEELNGRIILKIAFKDDWFLLAEGIEEFFGLLHDASGE